MAKFNLKEFNIFTKNKEQHKAYSMDIKDRLITEVLTSFFNENKYYGDNSKEIIDDIQNVLKADPKFIANLAVYTRQEMHLRSISHVLTGELAKSVDGKAYTRRVIKRIVQRPDDMSEILAYYINSFGKPIPNSMKKGIADAFLTFDEYSLAKYNKANCAISMKDLLCLTHPKAEDEEQSAMFKKVLEDNLKTPVTWETQLSAHGNNNDTWEKLIENNRLGYMAMLRNLRNIIKADPANINKVYEALADERRVLKSKQLPFRFYSAYKMLKAENLGTSKVYDTLEDAVRYSVKNIQRLKGKTFIAADVSGSMTWHISGRSTVTCAEIAVLMMALANHICDETITATFNTELYPLTLSRRNGIIANAESVKITSGGTDITQPLRFLIKNKIYVDRIILLSDNEINCSYDRVCQDYVNQYKRLINKNIWVHAIDMQGYGTQQFHGDKVNIIAGWNEKVLDFISKAEEGTETLKKKIENYYFN